MVAGLNRSVAHSITDPKLGDRCKNIFGSALIAGKGNYVFTIDGQKWAASTWKKVLMLEEPKWGIDVPSCRIRGSSPTFGSLILFFFRKSTTRSYYVMNFSQRSLRGAEIWHIWK